MNPIVSKISSMIALFTHISLLTPSLSTMKITMSFLLPASSVAFSFHPSSIRRAAIHHRVLEDFWKSPGLMGRRDRGFIFSDNRRLQSSLSDDKASVVDDQNSPSSTVENTTTIAAPSSEASSSSPPSPSPSPSSSSAHRRKPETPQPPPDPSTFPSWSYEPRDFFRFEILYESKKSLARVGRIHTVRILLQSFVPLFSFI